MLLALVGCTVGTEAAPPDGAPVIEAIEPIVGSVAGGEFLTIRGANLQRVTIALGGIPCTDIASGVSVASCRTGATGFVEGPVDVAVTGPGGETVMPAAFTYRCPWTTEGGRRSCGAVPPARRFRAQAIPAWITAFQADHGFVANAGPANLDDTSDHAIGLQSASLTTDGARTPRTLTRLAGPRADFTGLVPKLWIKLDGAAHATTLELRLGSDDLASYFALAAASPWITDGDWVGFTLSWSAARAIGTPDRAAITDVQLVVADDGAAAVTLHANGLALVPEPAAGVVSFTLDAGIAAAAPVLAAHALRATAYIDPAHLDATLGELTGLQALGWQIAALPKTMHEDDVVDTRAWLVAHGFTGYDHCAYPGFDPGALAVVDRYFASCRTRFDQPEFAPPSDPRRLRVHTVSTLAAATAAVAAAKAHHEWLVLAVPPAWQDLDALAAYVEASKLAVATVDEVLASW